MCYRRRAARRKDLARSRVDPELYQDAFTGRARAVPRCSYCLSPHHASPICPFAPPPFVTSSPFVASTPNGAGWRTSRVSDTDCLECYRCLAMASVACYVCMQYLIVILYTVHALRHDLRSDVITHQSWCGLLSFNA